MEVVPYSCERRRQQGIHNLEELQSAAASKLAHNPNYLLNYVAAEFYNIAFLKRSVEKSKSERCWS